MRSAYSFVLLVLMWACVFGALALVALGHLILPFVLIIVITILGVCM